MQSVSAEPCTAPCTAPCTEPCTDSCTAPHTDRHAAFGRQDGRLDWDNALCVIGITTSSIVAIATMRSWKKRHFGPKGDQYVLSVADFLLLGALPITYLVVRIARNRNSADRLTSTLYNLTALPWASQELTVDQKMELYYDAREVMSTQVNNAQNMQTLGVTLATLLFLRLVFATEAHPRIGVLVQVRRRCRAHLLLHTGDAARRHPPPPALRPPLTAPLRESIRRGCPCPPLAPQTLAYATDDLQHLLMLECIFFLSFSYLVYVMYGGEITEFITFSDSLTSLIQITLGNLPSNMYLGDSVFWSVAARVEHRPRSTPRA